MQHFGLKHYDEIKKILKNYAVSGRAKKALEDLDIVLIAAPTSTGKNTLIRQLLKTGKYYFIVSDTTRPPQLRDGKMEQNGIEYYFRNENEIIKDLKKGEFLEAAIIHEQQLSGISIRELEKAKAQHKVAVTDINIDGADNIKWANPQVKVIFLLPPSFEEWQRRIKGKTNMSEAEITNRLRAADKEIIHAMSSNHYQLVVAEDIDNSVRIIDEIVQGHDNPHQARGKLLLKQLHQDLQVLLKS